YVEVQNNNPEILRLVTVAVTYYKKTGEVADQQTLLFQDIQPHSSLTLPTQSNKKAATATAQLIQIKD
ncbi:MAG TPA: hypothetical protein VM888_00815, partial [Chitinophagaceae bacterium]|nr:hypothetical protein [Chitinophagaceae bacterium]